ncbi:ABC transporter permease [Kribbella sp. CA-253562]|uniref:ABC transporter permease n=1 Tax=Kribbella sp. CA-253562 TaxID=3239942 RepID=UPI003D9509BC
MSKPLGILVAVATWQLAVSTLHPPTYILPPPEQVVGAVIAHPNLFWHNARTTVGEVLLGLALATAGVLVWAGFFVCLPRVRRAVFPSLVAFQAIPKDAFAPMLILWLGFSPLPKAILAALTAFFPLLVATLVGMDRFTTDQRHLMASMGAGSATTLAKVRLWVALPSLLGGFKVAITFGTGAAVVGEYIGSDDGIGYQILQASRNLDGGLFYASIVVLVSIALLLVAIVDLLPRCIPGLAAMEGRR